MSRQSCIVVCAIVFLFFAMVSSIVALGSPSWVGVYSTLNNQTNFTLFGLWMSCTDGECELTDPSHRPAWLIASEVLYTLGTALIVFVFFWFCQIFARECNTEQTYRIIIVTLVTVLLSFCLCVTGICVFTVKASDADNQARSAIRYVFTQYYGLGMACFGAINTFVSCFLIAWEGFFAARWFKNRPYFDI